MGQISAILDRTYICPNEHSGDNIASQDSLTLLGFAFGVRPDTTPNIALIKKNYGMRAWLVRLLKIPGVDNPTIAKVFSSVVR